MRETELRSRDKSQRSIGIVVTLYDDYHYLGECLVHLLRGSRQHEIHVCLCIDESRYDDAAREIVAALLGLCKLDPEIVYNNRGGPAVARNQGIRRLMEVRPDIDYFFFMDADNYVGAGDFDVLVACLESAPEDVVYTYQNIIKFGEINQYVRLDVPFDRWRLLNVFYGETGNLVRANVFRDGQFFHEGELLARNTGEDVEFFRRLGGLYRGIHCPGTRFHYRTKLVHRDSVYWPKHDILSSWMRQANEELYARAEREFFASRFFDVAGIAGGSIADLIDAYHQDALRTQRSLLELGRGMLLCLAEKSSFAALKTTPLQGLLLSDLYRDQNKVPRLYRFAAMDSDDSFRYDRNVLRLGDIGTESGFGMLVISTAGIPPFPECRGWDYRELRVEVIDICCSRPPGLAPFAALDIHAFFANLHTYETARLVAPPAPAGLQIYKFPNHGDWLADQLRDDWRYLASQRDGLAPDHDPAGQRICVVAAMVMIGGSDIATIELLRALRKEFPDARIDLVIAHFVWSESGSNQGDNLKRLDWVSTFVDAIVFADLVQPHLRPVFLRRLLSSYDLLHIETSLPAYWLLKEIKEEGRRPKIVAHLFCWDYYMGLRVGFPVFAPKYADVVDVFSCQTRLVADYLSTRSVPRRKIFWIPYTSRFRSEALKKPQRERLEVLWIGRWVEQKNPELLVGTMQILLAQGALVRFTILVIDNFDNDRHFDQGRLGRLRQLQGRYPEGVSIVSGPVTDDQLKQQYREADVLLSTSAWEGVPFIFYEAMAFGCVPVATDVSANRELLCQEANGLLVPSADSGALSMTLARLAGDRALLDRLRAGVDASNTSHDAEEFTRRHIDIFRQLLAAETPPGHYAAFNLERGHAVADAELRELADLADRLGLHSDAAELVADETTDDVLLSLHTKLATIRMRTAELLDCLGLLPSLIDPTAQIRREGPGLVDKAAGFIAHVLDRTGLFAPQWLPTIEDAYRTLQQSHGIRGLAVGGIRFLHSAGRRWLMRRIAVRRLQRTRNPVRQ
jgi:glycosyltransferase involved in cell wall biosynthesis